MSITDGSFVCGHCGEWRTTCHLCIGKERLIDRTAVLTREAQYRDEAGKELHMQYRSIRLAAERRRGGI